MVKKEKELAEAEKLRMRRLMREGVITPEDLKEDSALNRRSAHPQKEGEKARHGKVTFL